MIKDKNKLQLCLIQSIPSPKAEPFKLWLAKVGSERIDEMEDPELSFDRAMETYLAKGYSKEWINQRLKSIEVRKDLTDEWSERGMKKGAGRKLRLLLAHATWLGIRHSNCGKSYPLVSSFCTYLFLIFLHLKITG